MKHAAFIGRRFKGKSTLAYHYARKHGGGLLVFDVKPSFTHPRFRCVARSVAELQAALDAGRRAIVYRPSFDLEREFCELSAVMWRRRGFAFLLDESSFLAGESLEWVGRWARLSPPDVCLLQTAHRPIDLPPFCRSLLSDWFVFRTTESLDLKAIEERLGPEVVAQVKVLGERDVLHVEVETGNVEVLTRPREWFHEISAPEANVCHAKNRAALAAAAS